MPRQRPTRISVRRRLAAVFTGTIAVGGLIIGSPAAHATTARVGTDVAVWDSMWSWTAVCTTGTVNWTCTYKAQSSPTLGSSADSTCREVGVSTQNSGANVLCAVDFSATVTVGWTFNSAGQQVGCEPLLGSGSFNYYSGNDSFFNVGGLVAAGVEDGVLRMNYESQDIVTTDPNQPFVRNWTVDFAVAGATCAPGARASGTTGAVGSVTNSIVQGSF